MEQHWRIMLFGGLRAERGEHHIDRFKTRKTASLLAFLACHPRSGHAREELIECLWPDVEPSAGRQSLSQALTSLRHQFEPPGIPTGGVIVADRFQIGLRMDSFTTDVASFDTALEASRSSKLEGRITDSLEEAIALYRGEFLPGHYEDWILRERDRLREAHLWALERLAHIAATRGEMDRALDLARRAVDIEPLREESQRELIRLLASSGQSSAALRQYAQWRETLSKELDLTPGDEVEDLVRAIRAGTLIPPVSSDQTLKKVARRARKRRTVEPSGSTAPPSGTVTLLVANDPIKKTESLPASKVARENGLHRLVSLMVKHSGYEITARHSCAFAFDRASDAIRAAIAGIRLFKPEPDSASPPAIAIHSGDLPGDTDLDGPLLARTDRLVRAARPGQILCSEATASLLRQDSESIASLLDLGFHRLPGEGRPERLHLIRIPGIPLGSVRLAEAERVRGGNLPIQLTRFFGRDEEIRALFTSLVKREDRIVTLSGPGGTGKSRLAIEVAARLADSFAGPIWFVPLADLEDPERIPDHILATLQVRRAPNQEPLDEIVKATADESCLLILDNLEHLLPAGATFVRQLLLRSKTLRFLVTSRHHLGVDGEREVPLAPLPTPRESDELEEMAELPSVQLFVDRAQAVRPDFQITSHNAALVAKLCARVDGMPLAIELAAARVQVLTPLQMLQRLEERRDFLVSQRKDVAVRHRTLRAAIDWSYRLLTPELQSFFIQLSVFRGGWSIDAAESVCDEPLALDLLSQLREYSLVRTMASGDEVRYQMLETIRDFALQHLKAADRGRLLERHCAFYLEQARRGEKQLSSPDQALWCERFALDRENFLAALATCEATARRRRGCARSKAIDEGLLLGLALSGFWQLRGLLVEGRRCFEPFLELGKRRRSLTYARALAETANLAFQQGDYKVALAWTKKALRLFNTLGDRLGIASAQNALGNIALLQGRYDEAERMYTESLSIRREEGDRRAVSLSLHNFGNLAKAQGDFAAARTHLEKSLEIKRELEDPWLLATTLQSLGDVAARQEDYAAATRFYDDCLAILHRIDDRVGIARLLNNRALVVSAQGDLPRAQSLHRESLAIKRELEDHIGISGSLLNLGAIEQRLGRFERAACLLGAAMALRERLSAPLNPHEQQALDGYLERNLEQIGEQRFRSSHAAGRRLTEAEAIAYALSESEEPNVL